MLGLEHETSRGSISLEYYGRTVGIKIMPTGNWAGPALVGRDGHWWAKKGFGGLKWTLVSRSGFGGQRWAGPALLFGLY